MNRGSKIIVSVVGIFIMLLSLIGITFAYFLTNIKGNSNDKSISVTTGKLELTYEDNSEEIIKGNGAIMPKIETEAKDAIGTKTFTVTNNGNDSNYVVIIDKVSVTKTSDGSETSFVSNDFRYTLSCSVKDGSGNVLEGESCNGVSNLDILPINGGILVSNNIPENRVHEYIFTLWYIDTGVDQSDDMGKTYQARINIKDMTATNPFQTGVTEADNLNLAYNIINNAKTNKNGTTFVNSPLTTPAREKSSVTSYKTTGKEATFVKSLSNVSSYASETWYYYDSYIVDESTGKFTLLGKHSCTYNSCYDNLVGKYLYSNDPSSNSNANYHINETRSNLSRVYKVTEATSTNLYYVAIFNSPNEAERVLAPTTDDYGTSYYFRGNVEDNFVNFAGMCWRIVRIQGDGSVKLILEDATYECNNPSFTGNWSDGNTYAFGHNNFRVDLKNGNLATSFKTFQNKLSTKISEKYTGKTISDKLKVDEWCYDDKVTSTNTYCSGDNECHTDEYYGAYTRITTNKKPSLTCTGTKLTKFKDNTDMYVATLTADELVFAGAINSINYDYYLMNNYAKDGSKGLYFWTLSPGHFSEVDGLDYAFSFGNDGSIHDYMVVSQSYSRPAVTLKSGSVISSGEGTLEKPYLIG